MGRKVLVLHTAMMNAEAIGIRKSMSGDRKEVQAQAENCMETDVIAPDAPEVKSESNP